MSETIKGHGNMLMKWKEGSKVIFQKAKVIVCGDITMDGLSKFKVGHFGSAA